MSVQAQSSQKADEEEPIKESVACGAVFMFILDDFSSFFAAGSTWSKRGSDDGKKKWLVSGLGE